MAQLGSRLASILHRLRAAAPKPEIIVIGVWNNDITTTRKSDTFYRAIDLTIACVAARARACFADPFPLFNPQGDLAREKARICAFTFICSRGEGHPTNAGYRAIAAAVFTGFGLCTPLVGPGTQLIEEHVVLGRLVSPVPGCLRRPVRRSVGFVELRPFAS
jgi:hypothetical protein